MFKIKKKSDKPKPTSLYIVIEDYTEFDELGNVTVCAMTHQEDLPAHVIVLSESYEIPLESMTTLNDHSRRRVSRLHPYPAG